MPEQCSGSPVTLLPKRSAVLSLNSFSLSFDQKTFFFLLCVIVLCLVQRLPQHANCSLSCFDWKFFDWVSVIVKKHHDHDNSYIGKHLIRAGLCSSEL